MKKTKQPSLSDSIPANQEVARSLITLYGHQEAYQRCQSLGISDTAECVLMDLARRKLGEPEIWPLKRTTAILQKFNELLDEIETD